MKVKELTGFLESIAPVALQEDYDNSGLQVGSFDDEINKCILCLDVTTEVLEEAIAKDVKLIISHHPLVFGGIKKLIGRNEQERCLIKAIQNGISIYSMHTNLDNYFGGINDILADKIGLENKKILKPKPAGLFKLQTFIPAEAFEKVSTALFDAGAGKIGNYDSCGFATEGTGSFRPLDNSNPYIGNPGKVHKGKEIKLEVVFDSHLHYKLINVLKANHPYEEVAYDVIALANTNETIGAGMIGDLEKPVKGKEFLKLIKEKLHLKMIRHTKILENEIKRVAVCGGAGSFLIGDAIRQEADVFVTGDLKYHQFFEAEDRILLADIGHFESERYMMELMHSVITKKFSNFACLISTVNTNAINYY